MTASANVIRIIAPLWRRRILRGSWFPTFAFLAGLYLLHYIGLAFVTKGTLFLYPIAAIYALALASGIGLVTANFQYMNMPATDQTNYISFYSTMANAAALLGTLAGRTFIQHSDGLHWTVLGIAMGNRQILMLGTAMLMEVVVVVVNRLAVRGVGGHGRLEGGRPRNAARSRRRPGLGARWPWGSDASSYRSRTFAILAQVRSAPRPAAQPDMSRRLRIQVALAPRDGRLRERAAFR